MRRLGPFSSSEANIRSESFPTLPSLLFVTMFFLLLLFIVAIAAAAAVAITVLVAVV